MDRFAYNNQIPEEAKEGIDSGLRAMEWLVPDWIQRVWVEWMPNGLDGGAQMTVHVCPEYRYAKLWIAPSWLLESEFDRKRLITHEFLHLSINPLADFAETLLGRVLEDQPKFAETAKEQISERTEMAVQDLAYILAKKY